MDNAAVTRLTRAGLSPEIILLKIEQSEGRFDVSTDALVELKTAGVADAVIKAMMLKSPNANVGRVLNPSGALNPSEACTKLSLYTLATNGWDWAPSSVCVAGNQLTVDEQSFALTALTVQCIEPEMRLNILGTNGGGDATWRLSDGKESFQLRGKPDEIRKLSDAITAAAPSVRHGKCSERELRALLLSTADAHPSTSR